MTIHKEILIGATKEEIVVASLTLKFQVDHYELSFNGETYSRGLFDEKEGQESAMDYLHGSGMWESAVADGQTERSKLDFYDNMSSGTQWEEILPDVYYIHEDLYAYMSSAGQINMHIKPEDFKKSQLLPAEIKFIWDCWEKNHMKPLKGKMSPENLAKLLDIFHTYPEFKIEQLAEYAEGEKR